MTRDFSLEDPVYPRVQLNDLKKNPYSGWLIKNSPLSFLFIIYFSLIQYILTTAFTPSCPSSSTLNFPSPPNPLVLHFPSDKSRLSYDISQT